MTSPARRVVRTGAGRVALIAMGMAGLCAVLIAFGRDASDFPDGFDAVQAAPASHKVIFENGLVRVLQVTIPPTGKTEPMHHHHWPSFFLSWETGGRTPHIRYHRSDGSVRDIPSVNVPPAPGHWSIHWMKPEPTHAIEVVEDTAPPGDIPLLRVEIKVP